MDRYELDYTIPSPGDSTAFVEFSPNGRFLAVGDRDALLYILDKLAGFHPTVVAATLARPMALVWETSKAFYVGLSDGCFVHYRIDLRGNKLVKGAVNSDLRGEFPATAIALDVESRTLVLSVGPDVFAFRRIRATSEFRLISNISNRFNFKRDPGIPAPPFPRSICFAPNNMLIVTFCRQNIASIVLEFEGDTQLRSSIQTAKIDYSGLPLLKAIISASEEEIQRLTRIWVYGSGFQTDNDGFPFLFINGGAATLSGSALGIAMIKDTVTQREIQSLEHAAVGGCRISVMAYHVSNGTWSIATADRGPDATIKVWTAQRSLQSQSLRGSPTRVRKGWMIVAAIAAFVAAMLSKIGRLPNVDEFSWFCFQTALTLMKICLKIGYLILDVAEAAVLDAENALD